MELSKELMFEILLGMGIIWWALLIIYAIYYTGDE
jgi:hypothetical protein